MYLTLDKVKVAFASLVIVCLTGLQLYAWHTGRNGAIFAAIFGIMGLVAGAILGFKFNK